MKGSRAKIDISIFRANLKVHFYPDYKIGLQMLKN